MVPSTQPTGQPSTAPTDYDSVINVMTSVEFSCSQTINGVDAATFLADAEAVSAFESVVENSTDEDTTVTVTGATDMGSRRRLAVVSEVQYDVQVDVITITSSDKVVDYNVTARASYSKFKDAIMTKLDNGGFTSELRSSGSAILSTAQTNSSSFAISAFSLNSEDVTPTAEPTSAPVTEILPIEAVVAIAAFIVVLLGLLVYYIYKQYTRPLEELESGSKKSIKKPIANIKKAKKLQVVPLADDDDYFMDLEHLPKTPKDVVHVSRVGGSAVGGTASHYQDRQVHSSNSSVASEDTGLEPRNIAEPHIAITNVPTVGDVEEPTQPGQAAAEEIDMPGLERMGSAFSQGEADHTF